MHRSSSGSQRKSRGLPPCCLALRARLPNHPLLVVFPRRRIMVVLHNGSKVSSLVSRKASAATRFEPPARDTLGSPAARDTSVFCRVKHKDRRIDSPKRVSSVPPRTTAKYQFRLAMQPNSENFDDFFMVRRVGAKSGETRRIFVPRPPGGYQ